jgi:hypothetical protein
MSWQQKLEKKCEYIGVKHYFSTEQLRAIQRETVALREEIKAENIELDLIF